MKVLQVCAYAAPYGGNFLKSLIYLSERLADLGIETIFCFPETCKGIEWCSDISKNHKVYFLPLKHARTKWSTYSTLKKIFTENKDIKIAHSHFELYDVPLKIVAPPKKVRIFWHVHDAIGNYLHGIYKIIWRLHYSIFTNGVSLLSVSKKHLKTVINLGFPQERSYYLPNGIDLSRIKPVENGRGKDYDLLIFGWDFHRKGVDLAISSVENNPTINLAIVHDGEIDTDLANIHIVKPSKDINTLYGKAKCFLHISRAEGLSYALLESLYAGLPVIVSDIEENLVVKDCPTAFFVRNENIEDISKTINMLNAVNFKVDKEKVKLTRDYISHKYSVEAWCEKVMSFYLKDVAGTI